MKQLSVMARFLRRVQPEHGVTQLLDALPDVSVFVKDRQGRFVYVNPRGCEYCGVRCAEDAAGKSDRDFFPPGRAERYRADDARVMKDGQPVLNRIEPEPCAQGSPRLVVTSKWPLRDAAGRVIGVIGCSREVAERAPVSLGASRVARAVALFYARCGEKLTVAQVAQSVGISVNQLERLFRGALGETPQRCLLRIRVEQAGRLLRESRMRLAEVAQTCGFYDQAHLSHAFAAEIGCSPLAYRRRHQA
ncbi:MAG TPA: PAS domain-containing protein [Kiritimatiellia bacterium]|jgi:PAS domain S-box-containing protein|nr:PAS domain-containing protein [Kiritimatiellia bacterium]